MNMQVPTMNNQLLQQAEAAFQQNLLAEAEQLYQRMLNANFLPGVMHFRLAMIANMRNEYEKAIAEHREALKVDPAIAAKILPQGSSLQKWVCPISFDTVEVKQCPVCQSKKQQIINVVNSLTINSYNPIIDPIRVWVKCVDCTHGYVKERPSNALIKELYSVPPPAHLQMWNYPQLVLFNEIMHNIKEVVPGGEFLDVGCAAGCFGAVAKDYGYKATGMDIHPIYRDSVTRFGLEFIEGDFTNYDFAERQYDVIALGDVLDHMVDLKKAVKVVDGILKKGGLVWLSTPNYDGAWTRALGAVDPMWQECEHIQYFSQKSLNKLFNESGFKIVDYTLSKRYQGSVEVMIERAK